IRCAVGVDGCVRYIDGVHRATIREASWEQRATRRNIAAVQWSAGAGDRRHPDAPPDGKARSAGDNAGDEVIMSIAGHVSRAMLSRYSHSRMEAKRRALDEIAARHRAADEKLKAEAERHAAVASPVTGK